MCHFSRRMLSHLLLLRSCTFLLQEPSPSFPRAEPLCAHREPPMQSPLVQHNPRLFLEFH